MILTSAPSQCRPGLLIPVYAPDGSNPFYVLRPNNPRTNRGGKALKYEMPKGQGMRLDCPPTCLKKLADPSVALWVTEGTKKAETKETKGV